MPVNHLFKKILRVPGSKTKRSLGKRLTRFPLTKTRPITLSDFHPAPAGWCIGEPHFIGIGTVKAGTSWWYSMLLDHPQIVENRIRQKELRYFVHFGLSGLKAHDRDIYRRAFAAPPGSLCGEWSPVYLSHPLCIEYIAETAPAARIMIILRNPIDRVASFLNEATYGTSGFNFSPEQQYVFDLFNVFPRALYSGLYARDLKRLLRFFNRKQILVLQYEKCRIDPLAEISRTYAFLGIDERHQPKTIHRAVNRKDYVIPEISPEGRCRLIDYFTEDVHLTMEMFPELDQSLWDDFM